MCFNKLTPHVVKMSEVYRESVIYSSVEVSSWSSTQRTMEESSQNQSEVIEVSLAASLTIYQTILISFMLTLFILTIDSKSNFSCEVAEKRILRF